MSEPLTAPLQIEAAWHLRRNYWPLLRRAFSADTLHTLSLTYIGLALKAGRLRVWYDGTNLLTGVMVGNTCHLVHGAGKLNGVLTMVHNAQIWARQQGAASVRVCGRPGWARFSRDWSFIGRAGSLRIWEKKL